MNPNKEKGGAHLTPKKKRTPTRGGKILRIVLLVVAALIVIAYAAYRLLVVKPPLPQPPSPEESGAPQLSFEATADRKKDFFTFVLLGRDTGGGGNTDTIMVASYDIPNQKLNVLNIPRDTMVNVSWDIKRINSVYNAGGGGEDGIKAMRKELSELIGFQPDFYVTVEWEAFGAMVEAIGGVEFDVPFDMNYDAPDQNLHIHLSKGLQKLNGDEAMGVVRWRKNSTSSGKVYGGYPDGDLGRIKTQQAFMTALVKQCLQIQNVSKINKFAKIFTEYVDTDLTVNNLAWFAQEAIFGGLKMENVVFTTLPNRGASVWSRTYQSHQSYVVPLADEMLAYVNENLSPYKADFVVSDLDLMQVKKDGTIYSTTGTLADPKANGGGGSTAPSKPEPAPTPVETTPPDATVPPDATATPPATTAPPDATVPPDAATPPATATPPGELVPDAPEATPAPSQQPEPTHQPVPEPTPSTTTEENTLPALPSPVA